MTSQGKEGRGSKKCDWEAVGAIAQPGVRIFIIASTFFNAIFDTARELSPDSP